MEKLGSQERSSLALDRAAVWRGNLLPEEFAARNAVLYAHPFGQERMRTFGLRQGGAWAASLDAIRVPLLVHSGEGEPQTVDAWHLASVLTLPTFRKQGLATTLIHAYLKEEAPSWSTLFSGIGPTFYEGFGYQASPTWQVSRPSGSSIERPFRALSVEAFTERLRQNRWESLCATKKPAAVFFPDTLWWDWVGCLYEFFGKIRGVALPRGRFWEVQTAQGPVWAAGMENPVSHSWDLWWASDLSEEILAFFSGKAYAAGLSKLNWWSDQPGSAVSQPAYPMLRSPRPAALCGVQLGDWW